MQKSDPGLAPFEIKNSEAFASTLIKHVMAQGFQALSKRDLELLIFFLLERDGVIARTDSTFDVAKRLRIPVTRAKALRRDAYARWQALSPEDPKAQLKRILVEVLDPKTLEAGQKHLSERDMKDGRIALRFDHPHDLAVFEHAIVSLKAIPIYELNRDVVVVRIETLFDIAVRYEFLRDNVKAVAATLRKFAAEHKELEDILASELKTLNWETLRQAINKVGIKLISKTVEGVPLANLLKIPFGFLGPDA